MSSSGQSPTYPLPSRSIIAVSCCVCFIGLRNFILEQRTLPAAGRDLKIIVGQLSRHAPPGSAVQKPNLHQERLVGFFNTIWLPPPHPPQFILTHQPAPIFFYN